MDEVVMDASAVLACIHEEPGADLVRSKAPRAVISSVNFAEVIAKLIERGVPADVAVQVASAMSLRVATVDADLGMRIGMLHQFTRGRGISLGDRACLALAARERLPAMTADRAWAALDLGIEVVLIR